MLLCKWDLLKVHAKRTISALHLDDAGQDLMEYALVAALIALVGSIAVAPVAEAVSNGVSVVGSKFKNHVDQGLHKGWSK